MKSIAIDDHDSSGSAGDCSKPYGLCLVCLVRAQMSHFLMYSSTFLRSPFQRKSLVISSIVLLTPWCPAVLSSCRSRITACFYSSVSSVSMRANVSVCGFLYTKVSSSTLSIEAGVGFTPSA